MGVSWRQALAAISIGLLVWHCDSFVLERSVVEPFVIEPSVVEPSGVEPSRHPESWH